MMELFQVGVDILNTSVSAKTKKILAQTGSNVGDGQTDANNVEWWQHVGFASRPAKPVKGKQAPQAITLRNGTIDCAIASQDLRGLDLYGQLGYGETCVYATGEDGTAQGRVLLKGNGSVNIFTKSGNDSGGNGMGVFVNPDGSISIASHNGAAVLIGTDGSLKMFNGSGGVQVLADGSVKVVSGGKLDMVGASVTLGGPTALPVAIAPYVLSAITALQVEIAAVAAALVACMQIAGPIVPATHGAAAAAATTAVGTAAGLLVPLALQIPSKRTSSD